MAAFLLWNTMGNSTERRGNVDSLVRQLVREHGIDIVLLVEYYPSKSASALSTTLIEDGLVKRNTSERFGVFARSEIVMEGEPVAALGDRVEIWKWKWKSTPNAAEFARFALVHGPNRRDYEDGTRRIFFRRVADAIRSQERQDSHRRSMILGDFNAQPFESAILASDGLHAIGVRDVRGLAQRHIHLGDEPEDFFYNPMWRMYGHIAAMDAGLATHYYQKNQASELHWHMLDQVVIRPEECASFPDERLKIITTIGTLSLLTPDGKPDDKTASDHLPIIFHWNL
jgi:hypothetical protein